MTKEKLSLMTFSLIGDFMAKTMTIRDSLELAKHGGLDKVDIMWCAPEIADEYRAAMEATGVSVYCYIASVSMFNDDSDILADLDREMPIAAALGAKLFMIIPYNPFRDPERVKPMGRDEVMARLIRGFTLAVEAGARHGIPPVFETTPQEYLHLSGIQDCQELLDAVPGLGLVFDTANMLPHGDDPIEYYEALKEHIVHVHVKDVALIEPYPSPMPLETISDGRVMQCVVSGQGVIPVKELCGRMLADGYNGVFTLEYTRPGAEPCTLEQHIPQLKPHLDHLL